MFRNEFSKEDSNVESYNFGSEDNEVLSEDDENVVFTAFFESIEENDVFILEGLFKSFKININEENDYGELALHLASSIGNLNIVRLLISYGAKVDLMDTYGDTAVHCAARQGNSSIIKYLYEQGASVNLQNKSGETGLHLAARHDYLDTIKQLCKCGANVNLLDEHGETALHIAVWHGYSKIVDVLGEVGINTDIQNIEEETALHCASVRGHTDCVKSLLEIGVNLDLLDKYKCTALHLALRRNHTDIALLLIKFRININSKDINGDTALHISCRSSQKQVVDFLCDQTNCKLNEKNIHGETAIHLAVKSKNISIIRRLCASGCKLNLPNSLGALPQDIILKKSLKNDLNKEHKIDQEILNILQSVSNETNRCTMISMLKPVLSYYGKQNIKNNYDEAICTYCGSKISKIKKLTSSSYCCNATNECVNYTMPNNQIPCCNEFSKIDKNLNCDNFKIHSLSNIPPSFLRYNLKLFGNCGVGKTTFIETLKSGYLASWFKKSSQTILSSEKVINNQISSIPSSNASLCSSIYRNGNSINKENSNKQILSSILTTTSSKSSLNSNNNNLTPPQSPLLLNLETCSKFSSSYVSLNSGNLSISNSLNSNHSNLINSEFFNCSKNSNEKNYQLDLQKYGFNSCFVSSDVLDFKSGFSADKHEIDCCQGINIQQINVFNVGEINVWEFSGCFNYLEIYDKFIIPNDNSYYLVFVNGCDIFEKQFQDACFWLDLLKSVIKLKEPFRFGGESNNKMQISLIITHKDVVCKQNYHEKIQIYSKELLGLIEKLNLEIKSCTKNMEILSCLLKKKYESVFNFGEHFFFLDTRATNSNELKSFKTELEAYKGKFFNSLGTVTGLLEEVIKKLATLRKKFSNFPILSYNQFAELIREQINILIEDEHIKYVCEQLEKLGEIVCLSNKQLETHDFIVYNINWLTNDVIGALLNAKTIESNGKLTGHYSVDDVQNLFCNIDALDLILVLECLELCTPCETEASFLYLFPCHIKIGRPECCWLADEIIFEQNRTYNCDSNKKTLFNLDEDAKNFNSYLTFVGLRLQCEDIFNPKHLLICLFPRIQILFEKCFQQNSILENKFNNELKLIHWYNGLRISYSNLEAIVSLGLSSSTFEFDSIEIIIRSLKNENDDCLKLFFLIVNLIEQYIETVFPSLVLQRYYYSPFELNCKKKLLYKYNNLDLSLILLGLENHFQSDFILDEIEKQNQILNLKIKTSTSNFKEKICEIITCGIDDIYNLNFISENFLVNILKEFLELFIKKKENLHEDNLKNSLIMENPILINEFKLNDLPVIIKQKLCDLLDPPESMGQDWCMLSVKLNLTEKLPILDSAKTKTLSPTWKLLSECCNESDFKLNFFLSKLLDLNRKDAIKVILKSLPIIKILSFEKN